MSKSSTPRRRFDSGAVAGSIAAASVLVLWFVVANGKTTEAAIQEEPSATATKAPGLGTAPKTPTVVEAIQSVKPWQPAIDLGREGMKQLERAFKQHEKAGDPFRFRSQTEKSKKKLETAIESLDVTLEAGTLSAKDAQSVKKWRDHFANAIRYTRK